MADSIKEAFEDTLEKEKKTEGKDGKDIVREMVEKNFMEAKTQQQKKEESIKNVEDFPWIARKRMGDILTNEVIEKYLESYGGKQREKMEEKLAERLGQLNGLLAERAQKSELDLDDQEAVKNQTVDFFKKKKFSKLAGILEGQGGHKEEENRSGKEEKKVKSNPKQETMTKKEKSSSKQEKQEEQKIEAEKDKSRTPQTVEDFRKMFGIGSSGKKNFVSVKDGSDLQITSYDPDSQIVHFQVDKMFNVRTTEKDDSGDIPVYSIREEGKRGEFKSMSFSHFQKMMEKWGYVSDEESSKEETRQEWSKLERQEKIDVSGVYRNERSDVLLVGKYMQGERVVERKEGEKKKQEKQQHRKAGTFSVSVNGGPVQFISAHELGKILEEGGYQLTGENFEEVSAQNKKKRGRGKETKETSVFMEKANALEIDKSKVKVMQKKLFDIAIERLDLQKTFAEKTKDYYLLAESKNPRSSEINKKILEIESENKKNYLLHEKFSDLASKFIKEYFIIDATEEEARKTKAKIDQIKKVKNEITSHFAELKGLIRQASKVIDDLLEEVKTTKLGGEGAVADGAEERKIAQKGKEPAKIETKTEKGKKREQIELGEYEMKILVAYRKYAEKYKDDVGGYDYRKEPKYVNYSEESILKLKEHLWRGFLDYELSEEIEEDNKEKNLGLSAETIEAIVENIKKTEK